MTNFIRLNFGKVRSDWGVVNFPDYVFFQEGPGLRTWDWTVSGMKAINVTNILSNGQVDTDNTDKYISLEQFQRKYSHFAVQENDIVIASSGNTYGKIGRIKKQNLPLMMNTSVIRLHPLNEKILHPDFLYSFMRSRLFLNQVEAFVIGSAQPNFGPSHLNQMKLILPPYKSQRVVASILSVYDNLIENNNRRIKILEEMAQVIYNEWFVKFHFPGHEKVKMVKSELGEIPEGWGRKPLNDIIDIQSGFAFKSGTFYDKGQYGIVTIRNVQDGRFVNKCDSHIQDIPEKMPKYCLLTDGDILLSLTGNVGRVCLCYGRDYLLNQRVAKLVLKENTFRGYAYFLYYDPIFRNKLENFSTGVAQQNLSPVEMGKMKVLCPTRSILEQYSDLANPILEEMLILFKKNAILQQTRDLLLSRIMSGELDVENLDIKVGN